MMLSQSSSCRFLSRLSSSSTSLLPSLSFFPHHTHSLSRLFSSSSSSILQPSSSSSPPPFHPSFPSNPSLFSTSPLSHTPSSSPSSLPPSTPSSRPPSSRSSPSSRAVIKVTQAAAFRLKELLDGNNEGSEKKALGIKIGVNRRGCNGLSYTMNYVYSGDKINKTDEYVEENGIRLWIDGRSLFYLIGTTMDYIDNDLQSEFIFNNPKEKSKCGCGESFNVD